MRTQVVPKSCMSDGPSKNATFNDGLSLEAGRTQDDTTSTPVRVAQVSVACLVYDA